MELKDILTKRRSVRKFSDKPVEVDKLQRAVERTLTAPSSRNSRSTRLWITQDKALLEHISQMRDYGSGLLSGAQAAIVVMGDESKTDLWVDNCAISATFIQLAVTAMDLVSCWIHINGRPCLKDQPDGKQAEDYVAGLLGIKEGLHPYCIVAIGYPEAE